jgi:HPr kinase/phosphorylase
MTAVNIHASCVLLESAGARFDAPPDAAILLLGESGAGKSDIVLQLLSRGARLVADDRVELFVRENLLWARAPANLAGLLEVRGVGIVSLPFAADARVSLVVRLVPPEQAPRLPERQKFDVPPALAFPPHLHPPLILLSASDISAADRIVLAAAAFANALFRDQCNSPEGLP